MVSMAKAPESREEWLAARRTRLGATDVSAILGLNPYRTAYEVWLDKRNMLEPWDGNEATRLGQLLEPAILDEAERRWGSLERQMVVHDINSPIAATLDGWLPETEQVVEVKTAGLNNPRAELDDWGTAKTDQIPDAYLIQMQTQLLCTEAESGYLLALISGRGLVEYRVRRDSAMATEIRQRCTDWWERHIIRGIKPPVDARTSIDTLKRIKRDANPTLKFTEPMLEVVEAWQAVKSEMNAASKRKEELEKQMFAALEDHQEAELPDGRTLKCLKIERAGYTVKPTTYPTFRIQKSK